MGTGIGVQGIGVQGTGYRGTGIGVLGIGVLVVHSPFVNVNILVSLKNVSVKYYIFLLVRILLVHVLRNI